jgi:hypothetical protein
MSGNTQEKIAEKKAEFDALHAQFLADVAAMTKEYKSKVNALFRDIDLADAEEIKKKLQSS